MKMGIKEFRERLSEVVQIGEPVIVTNHGKVLGTFAPLRPRDPDIVREAAEAIRTAQEKLKANGVDLDAEMAALGLDPYGVPLDDAAGR